MRLTRTQRRALKLLIACCQWTDDPQEIMERAIDVIYATSKRYDWIGLYILEPYAEHLALFEYYHGRPTPHVRIPVSEGICGAAVRENATLIVPDVMADPRYLACSLETRSEIVVPIRYRGKVVGEIDIDSDRLDAFDEGDRGFLERIGKILAPYVADYRKRRWKQAG